MIQGTINNVKTLGEENSFIANEIRKSSHVIRKSTEQEQKIVQETTEKSKSIKILLEQNLEASEDTQKNVAQANEELSMAKVTLGSLSSEVGSFVEKEHELSSELVNLKTDASSVKDVLNVMFC